MSDTDLTATADSYRKMSESELMDVARKYDELTEPAQTLLREEFARRNLEPPDIEESVSIEGRTLVTIRKYRDLPEAFVARSVLESAGIVCFLQDENTVRTDWLWSNMIGGARLQVAAEDEAAANEVLSQPVPSSYAVDAGEDFQQPRCPRCQSLNITVNDTSRKVAVASFMLLGFPFGGGRRASDDPGPSVWKCLDCGCKWEDDGEPAEPNPPLR